MRSEVDMGCLVTLWKWSCNEGVGESELQMRDHCWSVGESELQWRDHCWSVGATMEEPLLECRRVGATMEVSLLDCRRMSVGVLGNIFAVLRNIH